MLEPNHPDLSLRRQCQLMDVNRSSYYYTPVPVDEGTRWLMRMIDETHTEFPFFGTRKMSEYLALQGYDVGREKVRTIYEKLGLHSIAPGPHTSKPHRSLKSDQT